MSHNRIRVLFLSVALCSFTGCVMSKDFNLEGVMNVKRLGENQKQIARQLQLEEEQFDRLQQDIGQEKLKPGMLRQEIIVEYGEPVYTKLLSDRLHVKKALVYRHPVEFFASALIYLYLDENDTLLTWEVMQ